MEHTIIYRIKYNILLPTINKNQIDQLFFFQFFHSITYTLSREVMLDFEKQITCFYKFIYCKTTI